MLIACLGFLNRYIASRNAVFFPIPGKLEIASTAFLIKEDGKFTYKK